MAEGHFSDGGTWLSKWRDVTSSTLSLNSTSLLDLITVHGGYAASCPDYADVRPVVMRLRAL